jgi:hypothetical protein
MSRTCRVERNADGVPGSTILPVVRKATAVKPYSRSTGSTVVQVVNDPSSKVSSSGRSGSRVGPPASASLASPSRTVR